MSETPFFFTWLSQPRKSGKSVLLTCGAKRDFFDEALMERRTQRLTRFRRRIEAARQDGALSRKTSAAR
jgi:hypothetical protein